MVTSNSTTRSLACALPARQTLVSRRERVEIGRHGALGRGGPVQQAEVPLGAQSTGSALPAPSTAEPDAAESSPPSAAAGAGGADAARAAGEEPAAVEPQRPPERRPEPELEPELEARAEPEPEPSTA